MLKYPEKPKSLNLGKTPKLQRGALKGIKGQYLIFEDDTVFNVRSNEGLLWGCLLKKCSPHNRNVWHNVTAPASNDFYIAPNGITCMCPNAAVGDSGDPGNGIVYTKRTRSEITPQNAATTCTSGITDMSSLFNQVIFNEDISSWDVSDVTNMNQMFAESFAFNQPIGFWDVSSVTDMNGMFFMASAFDQPIGDWDVSQVTDMTSMFNEGSFNQPIDNWNVSSVTQMSSMFFFNTSFNQPLNSWDVSNVTNMLGMFENASSLIKI